MIQKSLRVAPKWAFGLVAAVLLMAPTVGLLYAGYTSAQDFNLASDNSNPRGMTWDGTYYRVVDSTDDKVYTYSSSGTSTSAQDFDLDSDNSAPRGITWDGTYYRVVDSADDKVYTYTSSGTHTSAQDFDLDSANDIPEGMTWDGTYLRVLDRGDDKVYTYTSSGAYTSAQDFDLASANYAPRGITWDGTYLRVVDYDERKVFTYTPSGAYTSAQDFDLASANGDPEDITWDGTYYGVVDDSDDKVYTYTSSGAYTSAQDFSLDSANGNPSGMTWDGTYLRVVDDSDDKVYTYTSSGAYTSAQDFDLASYNGDPSGMTWDGTYYRVVDVGDDKVYTYTSSGAYTSAQDFDLDSDNDTPTGMTWDGTYYGVVDVGDDKVYTYTSSGVYTSAQDFDLASANGAGRGITWDGTYLRVADYQDDKVYTYTYSGAYTSAQDFALASANDHSQGMTWDGTYYRVVDVGDDKVYTYEGVMPAFLSHGLQDDLEYGGLFAAAATTVAGDWTCIASPTAQTIRVNNAELTVHGFCAKEAGSGMEVEVHLSSTSNYADLSRFTHVTGHWRVFESGAAAGIYDDVPTDTDDLAFTEEVGGIASSNRLGFGTMAKRVSDDDCAEATDDTGFTCDLPGFENLSAGDQAVLIFGLSDEHNVEFADTPGTPDSVIVSRNSDYTAATVGWTLYDAVTEYQIERVTAVQIDVADASRIEYGDPVIITVTGTQAGIDEYQDNTVQAHRTYQYRVRARGANAASWSAWSDYVFSGATPQPDLRAPGNLELVRGVDSIIASWSAPVGDFDNYTLQRQELVVTQGSSFFGNVISLGDATWLPSTPTTYTDSDIVPDQIYEYRVAAVKSDQVGTYSDWFRIGPVDTSLGSAPTNFGPMEDGRRVFDRYHEFWLGWDAVNRADDYEVEFVSFSLPGPGQSMATHLVTDPTYFVTAGSRIAIRVRARLLDTVACAAAAENRCLSDWTAWNETRFIPQITVEAPDPVDDTQDARTMELRADIEQVVKTAIGPLGGTVNIEVVLDFMVLVIAVVLAGMSVALSWRRGMTPLGIGMGAAILIMVLYVGYRVLGTSVAWPIAAQALVGVAGIVALTRQLGILR